MTSIGKCTFQQLPREYQDRFTTGPNQIEEGTLIPAKHPAAALFSLTVPILLAVASIVLVLDLGYSLPSLVGLLSLIPLVIVSVWTVKALWTVVDIFQPTKEGVPIYGLVIDDQNLVMRELTMFSRKDCLFLPRERIEDVYLAQEFNEASGTDRSSILRVAYKDDQNKTKRLTLARASTLERKPYQLYDFLLAMGKSVCGEWSQFQPDHEKHASDPIIRINETDGVLIEFLHNEKVTELPFTYRPIGERTIVIESVNNRPMPSPQLELGSYTFEITVEYPRQGKFYMLRFDRDFAGSSSLRRVGQRVGAKRGTGRLGGTPKVAS